MGDSKQIEETIRRIAEESGVTLTTVEDQSAGIEAVDGGRAEVAFVAGDEGSDLSAGEEPVAPISGDGPDRWTWRDDHKAYERQREELGERYAGHFIAMHRGEVVGVGETVEDAAREGLARLRQPAALFVVRAGDPLPEPEELDMQMDAPRSVVCKQ